MNRIGNIDLSGYVVAALVCLVMGRACILRRGPGAGAV